MQPADFWGLTPYLTFHAVAGLLNGAHTRAWFQAAMIRAKKLPELDELITGAAKKKDAGLSFKQALQANCKTKGSPK